MKNKNDDGYDTKTTLIIIVLIIIAIFIINEIDPDFLPHSNPDCSNYYTC